MEVKDKKEYKIPQLMSLGQMKIVTQGGSSTCTDTGNTKSCTNPGGNPNN